MSSLPRNGFLTVVPKSLTYLYQHQLDLATASSFLIPKMKVASPSSSLLLYPGRILLINAGFHRVKAIKDRLSLFLINPLLLFSSLLLFSHLWNWSRVCLFACYLRGDPWRIEFAFIVQVRNPTFWIHFLFVLRHYYKGNKISHSAPLFQTLYKELLLNSFW